MSQLDRMLELLAAREPGEDAVHAAQRKLEKALAPAARRGRRGRSPLRVGGWLAAAAAGGAAVALWLPLAFTSPNAFARMQERFREFHTLRYELAAQFGDSEPMRMRVVMTRAGDSRAEIDDVATSIINTREDRLVLLVHPAHFAVVMPASETQISSTDETLAQLRSYRGAAQPLPGTRIIDGRRASGWQFVSQGRPVEVWASEDGLPLEMEVGGRVPAHVRYRFEFDVPVAPETFDTTIPAGYRLGQKELEDCRRSGSPLWSSKTTTPPSPSSSGSSASRSWKTVSCPNSKNAG